MITTSRQQAGKEWEMFDISKTTFKMAEARGMEITIENINGWPIMCFWNAENESEWMFSYRMGGDALHWGGNVHLPKSLKEELPATISSEAKLREMIKFLGDNRQEWAN